MKIVGTTKLFGLIADPVGYIVGSHYIKNSRRSMPMPWRSPSRWLPTTSPVLSMCSVARPVSTA
ncbi:hypothetical protein SAMN05518861_12169 [Mesorhizobium sp. YR577]|nr:hypothetical protein SAMN05518861_12169 [Mesorhizobium sp. YR577]